MTIDMIDARSALTVVSLLVFIGIIVWSYSGRRKTAYEEAANLPFADDINHSDDIRPAQVMHKENRHG